MNKYTSMAAMCVITTLGCGATSAQDLGQLGGMIPGAGSSMTSGSMSNVAGLLQYCVKNNYLGGSSGAAGVQDQLMSKLGGASATNSTPDKSSSTSDMLGQLVGDKSQPTQSSGTKDPSTDPAYLNGAKGMLESGSGKTTDLGSLGGGSSALQSQLTEKVCDTVLKQGKSFVGM